MQSQDSDPRPLHINCGELDMREATLDAVARIAHVNAGNVFVTPQTRSLLGHFSLNMGSLIEVPDGARLIRKTEVLSRDALATKEPQILANLGTLVFSPDVTVDDIETGLAEVVNRGRLVYPEHLGSVTSKVSNNTGRLQVYPSGARLIPSDLTLDEPFLGSLADRSALVVVGSLNVPHVVSSSLIEQKLERLQVMGKILLHEENQADLVQRIETRYGMPVMKVLPEGFDMVDKPMRWRRSTLESWSGRRIYAIESICIEADVEPDLLDRAIDAVVCESMVVCPAACGGVFSQKIDTLKTETYFYEGALWFVDSETTLRASRLELLEGVAALFVTGEVEIDPELDPLILHERLSGVYNWGTISCRPLQMDSLEARMVVNEGELEDSTPEPKGEELEEEKEEKRRTVTINSGLYKV